MINKRITVAGRAECIQLLDQGDQHIPAKIDTGADLSSIWASKIEERSETLQFVLFAEGSKYFTGRKITLEAGDYRLTAVANSFGNSQLRYVVKLRMRILGRTFKATFTLADRSGKVYPILIGRRLLKNKFIVDVSKGEPLLEEEKAELRRLHVVFDANGS